ncbi:hypothetical protein GGR39_003301 [Novosphingobium fluoreni]|uniref:Uncharacterized protein n=1 Tax=Novosphingobium fluoreni TaxID=1391222 RepID=A0A7W6C6T2_9SPHN|nr:hypothetical protein [Novosphingobium fluoreni]KTR81983.1 hypothetical protein NS277_15625 [Novosphingobium barchaimii]MBB3941620.1 hypothetical protein [Novosphingobium fluoreni]
MSGYGFGKKPAGDKPADEAPGEGDRLDFSGLSRTPVTLDPAREEAAIRRGDALGFVDRGASAQSASDVTPDSASDASGTRRRRRSTQPQVSVFIKGPKDTLDWFIEYTNERGHRSYWEALEEFRAMVNRQGE